MKVAVIQMKVVDGQPETNLGKLETLISANPGAGLYVAPELWTTGYAREGWAKAARSSTPKVCARLQDLARQQGACIAGSMVSLNRDGRLVNRLWVVGPTGEPVHYDKGHLFRPMQEHLHLVPGCARVRVGIGPFEAALSICFDLRFPEMYRRDAVDGADLFLCVSAWPHPRGEALRILARARALENQSYLVLSNRVGPSSDGTGFCGGSMVVGPEGDILAEAREGEAVIHAEVDPAAVRDLRERFPVLGLRAPGVDD